MFLTFVNKGVEKEYLKNREKISSLTLLPIALINIVDSMCSFFIFSKGHVLQIGPSMLVLTVTIIFMAESCGVLYLFIYRYAVYFQSLRKFIYYNLNFSLFRFYHPV